MRKGTICIDFDGTIYSYESGWLGPDVLPDAPLKGAKEAIDELKKKYNIAIFSVRANDEKGMQGIKDWMSKHNIYFDTVIGNKPNGFVFIDDRSIEFNNNWNEMVDKVHNFKTWAERTLPIIGEDNV